jgi:glycosyltransferase involved in cell wall biosynthesis
MNAISVLAPSRRKPAPSARGPAYDPEKWEPVSRLREARFGGRRKVGQDHAQGKMAMSPATSRRSLAGATILQLVPALRDDPPGHTAVDSALALLQSGARAIIAGEGGPLVGELRAFGGEWLPMPNDTFNPLRIRGNTRRLANLIAGERIDIVHAQSAGAAWNALAATDHMPVFLVTSFPDRLAADSWPGTLFGRSLARGDRVIAPSSYVSRAMIERYKIPPDRITVIPRAVDTARFSPAAVSADRIAALRRVWGILPQMRVVLVPGRIAPWNGQLSMIDAARLLVGGGDRNIAFVFAGEDRGQARYARSVRRQARMHGIDTLCRMVGPWSPARSGSCRKTCGARRACATTCAPAGWCGPATWANSRARSRPCLRSTSPLTRC